MGKPPLSLNGIGWLWSGSVDFPICVGNGHRMRETLFQLPAKPYSKGAMTMDDEENGRPLTGRAGVPNGTEPDKQSRAEPLIPVAWQPIETAPKDYTEILCFDPSQGVGIVNFEPRAVEPFWNAD